MRLRFTIRDLLWLALVVAMGIGWWIDRTRIEGLLEQSSTAYVKEVSLNGREYEFQRARITALFESAQNTAPRPEVTAEVIEAVRHHPDWAIKVRAMAILPYVHEREQAIDVLIEATKDREADSSGGGNVPLYATTYLADMKATRAISAIEDWIAFVTQQRPYDDKAQSIILKQSTKDLATLKASAESMPR